MARLSYNESMNLVTLANLAWAADGNGNQPNGKLPGKKFLTGNIMSAVQKAQKLTPNRRKKKAKVIDELKVFDNELEMQSEYNGRDC